jgi:hypothetical protein
VVAAAPPDRPVDLVVLDPKVTRRSPAPEVLAFAQEAGFRRFGGRGLDVHLAPGLADGPDALPALESCGLQPR